jgi:DNA (cytosine-5)-methyltransferase 1
VNVLSLFSGIGGLELGLERAGMNVVGQVEINPYCRTVLARHWPEVPRHDDVSTFGPWWTAARRPAVHLVCAGFPCQPFSRAGKQHGTADRRWMWPAVADVLRLVGPRYVLLENVAALLDDREAFGIVLADLATLGFDAQWTVLRASDVGAPHPRERLFVVAHPQGGDGSARDLLEPGRERRTPLAAGGLPRLAAHHRRRAADDWIQRQPDVARLAHGVPHQLERLTALGNAVVPHLAEHLGRLILADSATR